MNTVLNFWPIGLYLLINIMAFVLMGLDKYYARTNRWRTPEKRFFILAAFGGALGVYLGMRTFRHKTKHNSFVYGIPLLLVWNLFLIYLLWQYR